MSEPKLCWMFMLSQAEGIYRLCFSGDDFHNSEATFFLTLDELERLAVDIRAYVAEQRAKEWAEW